MGKRTTRQSSRKKSKPNDDDRKPPGKKSKPKDDDRKPPGKKSESNDDDLAVIRQLWQRYRYHRYSSILDMIEEHIPDALTEVWELPQTNHDDVSTHWNLRKLLPLLISVSLTSRTDQLIGEYMTLEQGTSEYLTPAPMFSEGGILFSVVPIHREQRKQELLRTIRQDLTRALISYPNNAQAWLVAINVLGISFSCSTEFSVHLCLAAADRAATIRQVAIEFLSRQPKPDEEVQEWVVELLLKTVCSAAEVDDGEEENDNEAKDGNVVWSPSVVEGISRFLAAMMCSGIQQHDVALEQLKLLGFTHRLHPHLWQAALPRPQRGALSSDPVESSEHNAPSRTPAPISFRAEKKQTGGVIPQHLYDRLCKLFQPDADFWSHPTYEYFSFYTELPIQDLNQSSDHNHHTARNLIDDVVRNYLLPLIQQSDKYQSTNDEERIVGYEWWVESRPRTPRTSQNLHFDTGGALFRRDGDGTVSHPYISSVLYLTGGDGNASGQSYGGPTIILDQTPDSISNADRVWFSHPINNSFMIFPGNLLHGEFPCSGPNIIDDNAQQIASTESLIILLSDESTPGKAEPATTTHDSNRLTLMIGFWTRNVPADMDPELSLEDRVYGPCTRLRSTDDTPWIRDLFVGDENSNSSDTTGASSTAMSNIVSVPLPCVSPAWEEITKVGDSSLTKFSPSANVTTAAMALSIPDNMNHYAFAIDPPACFKSRLMQHD